MTGRAEAAARPRRSRSPAPDAAPPRPRRCCTWISREGAEADQPLGRRPSGTASRRWPASARRCGRDAPARRIDRPAPSVTVRGKPAGATSAVAGRRRRWRGDGPRAPARRSGEPPHRDGDHCAEARRSTTRNFRTRRTSPTHARGRRAASRDPEQQLLRRLAARLLHLEDEAEHRVEHRRHRVDQVAGACVSRVSGAIV